MPSLPPWRFLAVLALLSAVPQRSAAQTTPGGQEDEQLLKSAGLETDGAALLRYFRARVPSKDDQARLAALVRSLGSRSFAARRKASGELVAAGETALAFLKLALSS